MTETRLDLHQSADKGKTVVASSTERFKFLFRLNKQRLGLDSVAFREVQIGERCAADRDEYTWRIIRGHEG
jgi:hypothetical protein